MRTASFEVTVTESDARRFAELSGDWNPLHTSAEYAAGTPYRFPILHGALCAGFLSRLAGMHIPGEDCLLHAMRLRFAAPISPPVKLLVTGRLLRENAGSGVVDVTIDDADTGRHYVDGGYDFGRHQTVPNEIRSPPPRADDGSARPVLVTGAAGGLGGAVLRALGSRGLGVSRSGAPGALAVDDFGALADVLGDRRIDGIVHCGWPAPDNRRLTSLGAAKPAIQHYVAEPLEQMIRLAQVLTSHGGEGAALVFVGSSFAQAGRHAFRMPLYSLAKSLLPSLTGVLALELGAKGQRCISVVFDVIEGGGMNSGLSQAAKLAHGDRSPFGRLITPDAAAAQIRWVLSNPSMFVSGATITLTGGALP